MNRYTKIAVAVAALVTAFAETDWFAYRPHRLVSKFVGHLSNQRYEEAAQMLRAPSSIEVTLDEGLIVADHTGNTTTVVKASLPFLSGGGTSTGPDHFSVSALKGRTAGGSVKDPITIYLSFDGGKIRIKSVDEYRD